MKIIQVIEIIQHLILGIGSVIVLVIAIKMSIIKIKLYRYK